MTMIVAFLLLFIDSKAGELMDADKLSSANQGQYTTYIQSWDADPVAQVKALINNGTIHPNTMVDIAFGSYNWDPNHLENIPGLQMTKNQLEQIVALIHGAGGKVSLSFGGANSAYNYYGSTMYGQPWATAKYINDTVQECHIDGVDFDVEAAAAQMPADFATQQAEVINTLRSMNSNLYISLTLPAQAWGSGDYQKQLLDLTIGNINTFQPMEYDLWIDSKNTYAQQIQSDIEFYINTWKIPPSKITLGLMPGPNDLKQDLSLEDAKNLTQWAVQMGLNGIMTWDAEIDGTGVDGNAPYAYTKAIENVLHPTMEVQSLGTGKKGKLHKISASSAKPKKPKNPDIHKKI